MAVDGPLTSHDRVVSCGRDEDPALAPARGKIAGRIASDISPLVYFEQDRAGIEIMAFSIVHPALSTSRLTPPLSGVDTSLKRAAASIGGGPSHILLPRPDAPDPAGRDLGRPSAFTTSI